MRRNVDRLKESLEKVVVPIFCTARVGADQGAQTEKLDKVRCMHGIAALWRGDL